MTRIFHLEGGLTERMASRNSTEKVRAQRISRRLKRTISDSGDEGGHAMRGENWRRHKVGMKTVITPAQLTGISDCLLKLNNKVASAKLHKSIHKSTTKL